jgi:hypothetical protein
MPNESPQDVTVARGKLLLARLDVSKREAGS